MTSWMTLAKGTPVVSSEGQEIGKVTAVVADREKDIFSGLAVSSGLFDSDRFVPADSIAGMADDEVRLSLSTAQTESLEPYEG